MANREKRNLERRVKYDLVLNATGNTELARRARMWSLKTINEVLHIPTTRMYHGREVSVIERPIKYKPLTERQRKNRARLFESIVVEIPDVNWRRRPRGVGIKPIPIDYPLPTPPRPPRPPKPSKPPIPTPEPEGRGGQNLAGEFDIGLANRYKINQLSKDDRKGNWAFWASKGDDYPPYILDLVHRINKEHNRAKDDSFGYAMVYYQYTELMWYDNLKKSIIPARFIDDLYEDNLKHLGV